MSDSERPGSAVIDRPATGEDSDQVQVRCPGWRGWRDGESGRWLGARCGEAASTRGAAVVSAADEAGLVIAIGREMFLGLVALYAGEWDLGFTATGRWWAVRRPGTADEPPLTLYAETVAGLGTLLAGRAGRGVPGA
jgi:hypothetical protein